MAKKALDGGVLIALAVDDPAVRKLKEEILAFCSELAVWRWNTSSVEGSVRQLQRRKEGIC